MTEPVISVVVPTHNRGSVLDGAIQALLAQDFEERFYEVIVVDNGSTDTTAALIREYERRRPGLVRYVFEGRQGVSFARNAGIAASRAPVIAFTDDDVRVTPEWLPNAVALLAQRPDVAYMGGPVSPLWPEQPPSWLTREFWSPLAAVDYGADAFEVPTTRAVCLISANLFMRRTALDQVGWFNPAFARCQDREMMQRLWSAGLTGLYSPVVRASTVVSRERMTRRYHRRWHRGHGHFLARMPYREHWNHGRLVLERSGSSRLFLGAPLFEYRELLRRLFQYVGAVGRGRIREAFGHELQVWYSSAFITSCIAAHASRKPVQHPVTRRPATPRGC